MTRLPSPRGYIRKGSIARPLIRTDLRTGQGQGQGHASRPPTMHTSSRFKWPLCPAPHPQPRVALTEVLVVIHTGRSCWLAMQAGPIFRIPRKPTAHLPTCCARDNRSLAQPPGIHDRDRRPQSVTHLDSEAQRYRSHINCLHGPLLLRCPLSKLAPLRTRQMMLRPHSSHFARSHSITMMMQ